LCFTELRYAEILGITLGGNNVMEREREREREKGVTARKKRMAVVRTTYLGRMERERERERRELLTARKKRMAVFRLTWLNQGNWK
jgi:hypothetical protein